MFSTRASARFKSPRGSPGLMGPDGPSLLCFCGWARVGGLGKGLLSSSAPKAGAGTSLNPRPSRLRICSWPIWPR
eukprot:2295121-Pyramimonas_sp.AAC.1